MRTEVAVALFVVAGCGEAPLEIASDSEPIVGGWAAPLDRYAWFVSLWDKNGILADSRFCGGALIGPRHVLTAAHCVDDGVDYVEIGPTTGAEIDVDEIWTHPTMDVAILELASSSSVEPLALNRDKAFPSTVPVTVAFEDRANLTVAGWGRTSYGGSLPTELREVKLPAVSNSSCEDVYEWLQPVYDTDLCAGFTYGDHGTCHGDSGGALYADLGGEQVSVGVVNWAYGCAWETSPQVFGRVSHARSFIEDHADGTKWVSPSARWHAALASLN